MVTRLAETCDALLDGRLRLIQPAKGHRAGTDALLLAALARSLPGDVVVDFGAGAGTAGLALAITEPHRNVILVENDPEMAGFEARNIALNGLEQRATAALADITSTAALKAAGLKPGMTELVIMNPPFLDPATSRQSPLAQKRSSHAMPDNRLSQWLKAARWILEKNGHVALIHRADAIKSVMQALPTGFGGVTLRPVHPRMSKPATRLLVTARLGSNAPASILPGLVLHGEANAFTPQAEAIHRCLEPIA